jgi:hypothetical protein
VTRQWHDEVLVGQQDVTVEARRGLDPRDGPVDAGPEVRQHQATHPRPPHPVQGVQVYTVIGTLVGHHDRVDVTVRTVGQ